MKRTILTRAMILMLPAIIFGLAAASSINAATYTVTTNADTGIGSLRQAVTDANGTAAADVIVFNIPAASCNAATGVCTITLSSEIVIGTGSVLTINGTGANRLTIDGGPGTNRIFYSSNATFTLRGVTLTGGGSVSGNLNGYGGAIAVNTGTTIISGVYLTGNSATTNGGAIYFKGGSNHQIINSAVSNNTAVNACGGFWGDLTTLTVTNSTVSGNSVGGNAGGGFCLDNSTTTLRNVTVSGNSSNNRGGGINLFNSTLNTGNSIIAGNTATGSNPPDISLDSGTVTSAGYNLIGDNASVTAQFAAGNPNADNDLAGTTAAPINPLLDPLASYGGTVPTRRLQAASPAIDKGNSALAGSSALDARSVIRPYDIFGTANASGGNGADIGAYELVPTSEFGWGYNAFGEVGDGTMTSPRTLPTAIAGGFTDIVSVEGGSFHALGLRSNGTLLAWGRNAAGQLGDNATDNKSTPVAVTGLTNVIAAAGGDNHSLALLADGTVRAWGSNTYGQLGDGTTAQRLTPVAVSGITSANPAVAIAAANNSSYALLADGSVRAWGFNAQGELGNNSTAGSSTPVQVSGLTSGVVSIDGGSNSGYALLADGSVRAWGFNNSAQLGDGTTINRLTPVTPTGLTAGSGVVQIAGGYQHAAALKSDGTVVSWGDNTKGQLGNGTTTNSSTPTATNISTVTQIKSSSGDVTYARLRDGSLDAWGFNGNGAIGNGTNNYSQTTPVQVSVDAGIGFFGANLQGGYAGSPLASVTAGANQFIRLGDATVNFANASTAGSLQIRAFDPSTSGLTIPAGYTLLANSTGYDITSTVQSPGSVIVCLKVLNVIDQAAFNQLFVLHDDDFDGALDGIPVSRNYQTREICRATTSFSPFVLAMNTAGPTAAGTSLDGRVTTRDGRGIANARITLNGTGGAEKSVMTNAFGNFRFDEVPAGMTYIINVSAKKYTFAPQVVSVTDSISGLTFTAQ